MTVQNIFWDLALDTTIQEQNLNWIPTKKTDKFKWSFAKVTAWIDTEKASIIKTWAWMWINQAWWNLVITTWTTAYSESIIRSNYSFAWLWNISYHLQLSQRIINQNFVVEWVDIVGDNLSFVVNSATSITVTKTAHWFTTADIWKWMWIGNISLASCLPQRIVIASIPTVDTITFTVVWFPASWSWTCNLFWYNYHQVIYSWTTATTLWTWYNTQRQWWTNTVVNATINTTAAPWHIGIIENSRSMDSSYLDQVPWTWTAILTASRAYMNTNIPDEDVELYLQIRIFNGSTAPASTTTMTMWFVNAEIYNPLMVNVSWVQAIPYKNAIPVTATITNPTSSQPNLAPSASYWHWTYHNLISAWSTNATSVKASAWNIWSVVVSNNSASIRYFKLYNKASAPTVWTDTPIQVYMVKWWETIVVEPGWAYWLRCTTWIAYAITWWIANTDTTAILANEVAVAIAYT